MVMIMRFHMKNVDNFIFEFAKQNLIIYNLSYLLNGSMILFLLER